MKKFIVSIIMLLAAIASPSLASKVIEAEPGPIQQAVGIVIGVIVLLVFICLVFGAYAVKRNDQSPSKKD